MRRGPHAARLVLLMAGLLALVGCGEPASSTDAGPPDAGRVTDAGAREDAGAPPDGGGDATDAGGDLDAGAPGDAGVDGGADAGPPCSWGGDECPERCRVELPATDPCEGATRVPAAVLDADETWTGHRCVDGTIGILAGVTLRIEPGSRVFFAPGAELVVRGTLDARGTADAPILLSARAPGDPTRRWPGIEVQLSDGARLFLEHATVEHAVTAVQTLERVSEPTTTGPEATVVVERSTLRFCGTGITTDDNTRLARSSVYCNERGVSVSSEDEPLEVIRGNNLCDHRRFAVFASQDGADATGNYWCTNQLAEIEAAVLDQRDDISHGGIIAVDPFLDAPAPEAPPLP